MIDPAEVFEVRKHYPEASHLRTYPRAARDENQPLRLSINQYIPRNNTPAKPGSVTFIGAGGIGFPKSTSPCLRRSFSSATSAMSRSGLSGSRIPRPMGESSVINASNLGTEVSWWDHSRDLLHIINTFHEDMPRPLVGFGHSIGGAQMAYLSTLHPALFTSLILIEPAVWPVIKREVTVGQARAMLRRRERWPNRAAAEKAIRKSPYYQRWDPRVLERHLRHGLRELQPREQSSTANADDVPVNTTASVDMEVTHMFRLNEHGVGLQGPEAITVADRTTIPDLDPESFDPAPLYSPWSREAFFLLPRLRPWVLYVIGAASPSSPKHITEARLETTGTGVGGSGGRRLGTVSQVCIQDGQHTMPLDCHMGELAAVAVGFVAGEMERWRANAAAYPAVPPARSDGLPPKLDSKMIEAIKNYEEEKARLQEKAKRARL